jgi:ribonuclease T2
MCSSAGPFGRNARLEPILSSQLPRPKLPVNLQILAVGSAWSKASPVASTMQGVSGWGLKSLGLRSATPLEETNRMSMFRAFLGLTLLALSALFSPLHASQRLDGYFIASDACPAFQSFRKGTNPGDVTLVPERAYTILEKNKSNATHYRIRIREASPQERWVAVSCGTLLVDCRSSKAIPVEPVTPEPQPQPPPTPQPQPAAGSAYLLALSWQPGFCQGHQDKPECESQTGERFDATNFTLHGLWPQPRSNDYCNVSNRDKRLDERHGWCQLPAPMLSEQTLEDLTVAMPGVASCLEHHEWIKHGTCYRESAESYFGEAVALLDQVNDSPVRRLFADHIGETLRADQIRDAFDHAFGPGSGRKVEVSCSGGLITELRINLRGDIQPDTPLSGLLAAGADTGPGCGSGKVDAVGF